MAIKKLSTAVPALVGSYETRAIFSWFILSYPDPTRDKYADIGTLQQQLHQQHQQRDKSTSLKLNLQYNKLMTEL